MRIVQSGYETIDLHPDFIQTDAAVSVRECEVP